MELPFPASWQVEECRMAGHNAPPSTTINCATSSVRRSAPRRCGNWRRGRKQAVILFDDLTRPAPTWRILPMVLAELHAAGFTDDRIRLVGAFANHAVMSHEDFVKKLGAGVVRRYRVYNHNPFDHLVEVGTTSRGTRVEINREVMACDLRIGIGGLIPHLAAGFGGGAKLVVPGVAGIATVDHNHRVLGRRSAAARASGPTRLLGNVDDSVVRQDLEEAVSMVGLDFKVDLLINQRREVVQVFAGQFMEQHRAGVAAAQRLYTTPLATECDVVVANTYPIENQATKGIWPAEPVAEGGWRRRGGVGERRGTGAPLPRRPVRQRLRRGDLVAGQGQPDRQGGPGAGVLALPVTGRPGHLRAGRARGGVPRLERSADSPHATVSAGGQGGRISVCGDSTAGVASGGNRTLVTSLGSSGNNHYTTLATKLRVAHTKCGCPSPNG